MNNEILRKQILYRAVHRGCKETDFLLGNFFSANIANLEEFNIELCAKFIVEDDMLIYDWIMGKVPAELEYEALIASIRKFHNICLNPSNDR